MSYLSSTIGPSPFLTTSSHHFHSNNYTSTHPHYSTNSTNSYTSTPTYLAAYATPAQVYHEKYFPKDVIHVLPGITNLESRGQDKLIHPLNTYSGNIFSTHQINSPFNRGQIYLPNQTSINPTASTSSKNLIDNKTTDSYLNRKDNPFNKKYLLSQKNAQLQNCSHYYPSQSYKFQLSDHKTPNIASKNPQTYFSSRQPTFSNEQRTNTLQLKSKQNININHQQYRDQTYSKRINHQQYRDQTYGKRINHQQYRDQTYGKRINLSDRDSDDRNPFQTHVLGQNYRQDYLVQSLVDQKQFGSFGQGNQAKQQNSNQIDVSPHLSYQNSRDKGDFRKIIDHKHDKADSIIVGLTKMVSNEQQKSKTNQDKYRPLPETSKTRQPSKRQLIFVDSDQDQRRSGTFVVPNAIIEQMNITRVPSNPIRKKEPLPTFSNDKQHQKQHPNHIRYEKEHAKYSKQEAIQVGKNPPSRITMRGRTFQKISL